MDLYSVISHTDYFRGLNDESRKELAKVCFARTPKRKEVLFMEGDEGHSVYLLINGSIQLAKMTPEGDERVIKVVRPGEVFAEAILFEINRYPVTATALVESMVVMVPRKAFRELLKEEGFRDDFIASLIGKQRYLTEKILTLTSLDVEERFFRFLREQHGEDKSIVLTISKKDVAAAIGAAPETLSRLVQKLEDEGRLVWKGRKIELA